MRINQTILKENISSFNQLTSSVIETFNAPLNPDNIIVHLGVGAFHRAHQAFYTSKVISKNNNWGIIGACMRSNNVQKQLEPQDNLYTVVEKNNQDSHYHIIQTIQQIIVAPEEPDVLLSAMSQESCKIFSLTITEKGYCHNPANGKLNKNHPSIQHDLKQLSSPISAIGFIVRALQIRAEKNRAGVSVLSCDNLPANGLLTQQVVLEFAELIEPSLAEWIKANVSFPSSMVDRIVPATTQQDKQDLLNATSYQDEAMVVCEPFKMWVIEDNFVQARPPWEDAGAIFVNDVHQYETMKLRLLNGSHSAIAYLGALAGHETVYQVMADQPFKTFIEYLMKNELAPSIKQPEKIDLKQYQQQLIERFNNKALQHSTHQIAMDGSQKIPQRLLQPIMALSKKNFEFHALSLVVASWIRYTQGENDNNEHHEISDPMADTIALIHDNSSQKSTDIISKILSLSQIFDQALSTNIQFTAQVAHYFDQLCKYGARKTILKFLDNHK